MSRQLSLQKLLDAREEQELFESKKAAAQRAQPRIHALSGREALLRQKNPQIPTPKPPVQGSLPSKFSWEDQDKVTPIKNQNPAGTCWAFADIALLETQLLIRDGLEIVLAEQDLIDCGRKGAIGRIELGVSYKSENPYKMKDAPSDPTPACKNNRTPFYVEGPVSLDAQDTALYLRDLIPTATIKKAILEKGGVITNIHIPNGSAFYSISSKTAFTETIPLVYDGYPKASDKRNNGSHIIIIVGWDDSINAWRIKNSWGTSWGDKGFAYITHGSNLIGRAASYWELGSPDVIASAVWEQSNAEEVHIHAWPYPYFQSKYDELWKAGWRLWQLATAVSEGRVLYSASWRKGTVGEIQYYGLKYADFKSKYDVLWKDNWRIHLLDNYVLDGTVYYVAVWRQTGGAEVQHFEEPYEQFQSKYDELWKQGWRLELLSNPVVGGQVRYTGIWRKGSDNEIQWYGEEYSDFQKKYDELWKDGWRIHLLQNYRIENKVYFNGTWRKGQSAEVQWYGLTVDSLGRKCQELANTGWRIRLLDTY
jgi:hypothetical protein